MENKVGIYRIKNGLTLKQLSDRTGISTTTLSKIENNHTNDILLTDTPTAKARWVLIYIHFQIYSKVYETNEFL